MRPPTQRPRLAIAATVILSILVLFLALKRRGSGPVATTHENSDGNLKQPASSTASAPANPFGRNRQRAERLTSDLPPEQVVSNKLSQFARNRRAVVEAMARK